MNVTDNVTEKNQGSSVVSWVTTLNRVVMEVHCQLNEDS